jgi:hypothetical protein
MPPVSSPAMVEHFASPDPDARIGLIFKAPSFAFTAVTTTLSNTPAFKKVDLGRAVGKSTRTWRLPGLPMLKTVS